MRGGLLAGVVLLAAGFGAWAGARLGPLVNGAEAPAVAAAPAPPPAPLVVTEEERSTIELFRAARDSVVAISTSDRVTNPWTRETVEQPAGSGSGFLWDADGHVVTNNHVVGSGSRATVHLADGRSLEARLVGTDATHDLAVLRIEDADLPAPLPRGESRDLEVGQKVLAIGNPFGLDWTLTTGIVSALERELPASEAGRTIRGLIQTDAAINPGNSGGPLLDSGGRLVGVNTAIYSPSGASAGIGFSVPVGTVNRVVPQIIATGRYSPPTLGLVTDARLNAAANRQGLGGVLVLGVEPGSAAEAAGVEPARIDRKGRIAPGDVVVAVDGVAVDGLDDYLAALDLRAPGDTLRLRLRRDGREREEEMALASGG